MKHLAKVMFVVFVACAATGCATLLNQQTQPINISASNGAAVEGTIDGSPFKGPGVVNVLRENKDKVIAVSTPGCAPQVALPKQVDNKFFINLLSGGVFGSSTDYGTKKMWRYNENVVIQCK